MRSSQLLCLCSLFVASAASECGGDKSCSAEDDFDADKDGVSVMQNIIQIHRNEQDHKHCTLPAATQNVNEILPHGGTWLSRYEKTCGAHTVLKHGEMCKPSCSEGYTAKDTEFECQDGILHEVGGGVADVHDLICQRTPVAMVQALAGQCEIPEADFNSNEKPCGSLHNNGAGKVALANGEKCTPSCSNGYAAKAVEFECIDGKLHEVGGGEANPQDLICRRTPVAAVQVLTAGQCKVPQQDFNSNEKACGMKHKLDNGENCKVDCSTGYAAKDVDFTCVDGKLQDSKGAEATADDLLCKKTA
jgi:hypothetical protein